MGDRFRRRFEIRDDQLQRLMHCIVEHAEPDEARDVERVLSALVTLSARTDRRSDGEMVSFVPPKDTAPLVERALAAMERTDRIDRRTQRARA